MSFFTNHLSFGFGASPRERNEALLSRIPAFVMNCLNSMLLVLAMEAVLCARELTIQIRRVVFFLSSSSTTLFRASNTNDPPNQPLSVATLSLL